MFVTDKGCEKFASMIVEMPKTTGGKKQGCHYLDDVRKNGNYLPLP